VEVDVSEEPNGSEDSFDICAEPMKADTSQTVITRQVEDPEWTGMDNLLEDKIDIPETSKTSAQHSDDMWSEVKEQLEKVDPK
jgi:hypothetical protein